ncbi:hypothetical protein ACHAWF_011276 [Thalassiosira exigua]
MRTCRCPSPLLRRRRRTRSPDSTAHIVPLENGRLSNSKVFQMSLVQPLVGTGWTLSNAEQHPSDTTACGRGAPALPKLPPIASNRLGPDELPKPLRQLLLDALSNAKIPPGDIVAWPHQPPYFSTRQATRRRMRRRAPCIGSGLHPCKFSRRSRKRPTTEISIDAKPAVGKDDRPPSKGEGEAKDAFVKTASNGAPSHRRFRRPGRPLLAGRSEKILRGP